MNIRKLKGSTDQSIVLRALNNDGTPAASLSHDTAGLALSYRRDGATATTITPAALTALDSAHADGGVEPIGNGYFRLDLPDAALADGATGVLVYGAATDIIIVGTYIQLERTSDPIKNRAYSDITFLMVDNVNHSSAEPGLTVTAQVSKDGGALAAVTGTVTEIGNGAYGFDASAADMNANVVSFRFSNAAADDAFVTIFTTDAP